MFRSGCLPAYLEGTSVRPLTASRVLSVLDPRPLLDEGAAIAARYGGTGILIAASLAFGRELWFGTERNVGHVLRVPPASLASSSR